MSPRSSTARTSPRASAGAAVALLAIVGLAAAGRRPPEAPAPPEHDRAPAPDARRAPESPAARALREGRPIDVNTASAGDLQLLPGIGPALSARIVESRRGQGPFESVQALRRVRGIGPKTVDRLAPLVRAGSPPPGEPEPGGGPPDATSPSLARPPRVQ